MSRPKNKIRKDISKKIVVLLIYLSLVMLIASFMIRLTTSNGAKSIFGYTMRLVVSGSMEPAIKTNSINIIKTCDISEIEENDIICFNYGSDIVHRVIEKTTDESNNVILHTKGDANSKADSLEINSGMVIGKVIYTFNGLAPIIEKYSLEPGNIDSASLSRNIILIGVLTGVGVILIIWLLSLITIVIKAFFKKDDYEKYIDSYIKDIDELLIYREMLLELKNSDIENTPETRLGYISSNLAKAKAIIEIKELHNNIKDFKKSIKHCYYVKNLGIKLDAKYNEQGNKSIREIIKYTNKRKREIEIEEATDIVIIDLDKEDLDAITDNENNNEES